MLCHQILTCTIDGKYKKSYKNNKFKISANKWNENFESPIVYTRYSTFF